MNFLSKTLLGLALLIALTGLFFPRYQLPSSLGGTTRANTTVDGTFTVTGVTTLTGATTQTGALTLTGGVAATTTFSGGLAFNASTTGLVLKSTNSSACVVLQYTGTTGVIATTSIACP